MPHRLKIGVSEPVSNCISTKNGFESDPPSICTSYGTESSDLTISRDSSLHSPPLPFGSPRITSNSRDSGTNDGIVAANCSLEDASSNDDTNYYNASLRIRNDSYHWDGKQQRTRTLSRDDKQNHSSDVVKRNNVTDVSIEEAKET